MHVLCSSLVEFPVEDRVPFGEAGSVSKIRAAESSISVLIIDIMTSVLISFQPSESSRREGVCLTLQRDGGGEDIQKLEFSTCGFSAKL